MEKKSILPFVSKIIVICGLLSFGFSASTSHADPQSIDPDLKTTLSLPPRNSSISSEILSTYSPNDISRAIVSRMANEELRHQDEIAAAPMVDFQNDTDIMLFFHSKNADKIAKGGFLNKHQVLKFKDPKTPGVPERAAAEDVVVGFKMGTSDISNRIRPKSAFLNVRSKVDLGIWSSDLFNSGYGDAAAVFKNRVKDRAFWCSYDVMLLGYKLRPSGQDVILINDWATFRISKGPVNLVVNWCGTFKRQRTGTPPPPPAYGIPYYEADILGDLPAEDIEYLLVLDTSKVDALKAFQKPVYLAKVLKVFSRSVYVPGKLLYRGKN